MKKFLIIMSIMQLFAFSSYGASTSAVNAPMESSAIARPSDTIGKKVIKIIVDKLYIDNDDVRYGTKLMSLCIDELDVADIVITIEEAFKIVITEPEFEMIEKGTVNDLLKLVRAKVSSKQ